MQSMCRSLQALGGGMKSSIATRKSTVIFRTFISVVSLIFQEARCGLKKIRNHLSLSSVVAGFQF